MACLNYVKAWMSLNVFGLNKTKLIIMFGPSEKMLGLSI